MGTAELRMGGEGRAETQGREVMFRREESRVARGQVSRSTQVWGAESLGVLGEGVLFFNSNGDTRLALVLQGTS